MNRLDRALGILLLLRSQKSVSANDLAKRFEVSPRTIYRDIEVLAELGVPVYAEMGRAGGFRLMEGYFLPPVMFSNGEAISLLLSLTALRRLRARPFAAELDTAEHKLLAAMPDHLRSTLAQAQQFIGFEETPVDMFVHPELEVPQADKPRDLQEDSILTIFLQAILERRSVSLNYRSPYSSNATSTQVLPRGVIWDRDRWYLVGPKVEGNGENRLWRADRVLAIRAGNLLPDTESQFDVKTILGRQWLGQAMKSWSEESPVKIRLTTEQATRLKGDWFYSHASYETETDGQVLLTFGQDKREFVFELLRWLGPGAELIEPKEWRAALREELSQMLLTYQRE